MKSPKNSPEGLSSCIALFSPNVLHTMIVPSFKLCAVFTKEFDQQRGHQHNLDFEANM